jgi:hypothetical protein
MKSEAVEVRAISQAVAVLLALIGVTLLSTVRFPDMPAPGISDAASIKVVLKKDADAALLAAQEAALAAAAPMMFADADGASGLGEDFRLWINGPGDEIVFRNADRFRRCVMARAQQLEEPDCPSASDMRQMVLEKAGGLREAANAQRGA